MESEKPVISVIVCAHNEEEYVGPCLTHVIKALENFSNEVILVADRCTDNTVNEAEKYNITIIEKKWKKWENSYSESLQTGYFNAKGSKISIIDADIIVPNDFFEDLIPMIKGNLASVAADVVTFPNTFWNRLIYAWERTYKLAPLGREPYGAGRVISKEALDKIKGFPDTPTPDTAIDINLANEGYESKAISTTKVYHIRKISPKSVLNGQINCGRGRFSLGISFIRTAGHAIFRLRPFIICGWLIEWKRRSSP